jgi:hypothetical protein
MGRVNVGAARYAVRPRELDERRGGGAGVSGNRSEPGVRGPTGSPTAQAWPGWGPACVRSAVGGGGRMRAPARPPVVTA